MLYLCDGDACGECNSHAGGECRHTTDPAHALHGSGTFEVVCCGAGKTLYVEVECIEESCMHTSTCCLHKRRCGLCIPPAT